ncbi:MAG: GNAT family N-acetyltransferase [Chloroflexota bacterium]
MHIDVQPATLEEKPILQNLMELYLYDYSEIEGDDVDDLGLFGYDYLGHYWTEPQRHAYLVRVDGKLAGFALLQTDLPDHRGRNEKRNTISEFFILRKYRRRGIGEQVARYLFDNFPGKWQVAQIPHDVAAQSFWLRVIQRFTGGHFETASLDNEHWKGSVLFFEMGRSARSKQK